MNATLTQTTKSFQQDLRHYLPRSMAGFVITTLISQLTLLPPAGRGFWYIPNLVIFGLLEGAFGALWVMTVVHS